MEEKDLGQPVLGAGTSFGITKANDVTGPFIEFLKTPIAHEIWMAQRGFLTPHKGVNLDLFGDPTLRPMNEILLEADTFRFDGVGPDAGHHRRGRFWTGMVDFVGGASAEEVASEIQQTWDSISRGP